eukprot:136890_1
MHRSYDYNEEKQPKSKPPKKPKLKLYIGLEIEVYSKSKNKWIEGKIIKIKNKLICVEYGAMKKWLQSTTKEIRAKTSNIAVKVSEKKIQTKTEDQSLKNSIAFKTKSPLKVKIHVGSPVEVYSMSQNGWINGKVTKIKNNLVKIAYGEVFALEKWLNADSNQYRAKLDIVDAQLQISKKDTVESSKQIGLNQSYTNEYTINSNESNFGCFSPGISDEQDFHPPPPPPQYITRNFKKELYDRDAFESIRGSNNKRGYLRITIYGAMQLRSRANYASITIDNETLKTKKCSTEENPVWKETLKWSNFRPHIGKTGVIRIYNKSAILGEKLVGSAEFELPTAFKKSQKMIIDICDGKNILSGIVDIEQCVVKGN